MYPNNPAESNELMMSLPESVSTFFRPKLAYSCTSSGFTFTTNTFRLSPLTTAVTIPLTGEENAIDGYFLLTNSASPAFTWSPSRTMTLGDKPGKEPGDNPNSPLRLTTVFTFSALPFRRMSKPLRIFITFVITSHLKIWIVTLFLLQIAKLHN